VTEGDDSTAPLMECDRLAGWALVDYFKAHARRVYGLMDRDPRLRSACMLLDWIRRERRGSFKRWEAAKDLQSDALFPTPESLDGPLAVLEAHNVIREAPAPARRGPGRKPARAYLVNPKALSGPSS
jgi:hypothetical protein